MWSRIASIILRNRFFILAIISALTVFFGYFIYTDLRIDNRYGIMLPKDNKTQHDYELFKKYFGQDGTTLVIAIKSDSLYTEKNFKKWSELGTQIRKLDGVEHVISEATLIELENSPADTTFKKHPIFYDEEFDEVSIETLKQRIKKNPIYNHLLYNDSSKVSLMMVSLNEKVLEDRHKSKVVNEIEKISDQYKAYFSQPRYSGLPHIRVKIAERILDEMIVFLALSVIASSLLLYLFFRSLRIVFQCSLVVLISVIWALGTVALFGYALTIMMALIPPLLIVIGVPNCVFIITRYHQEYVRLNNKTKALFTMIRRIGPVTFLTNLTTAVGFVTFTSSDRLAEFGIISSLNIMVVFVLSICIVPIIASYMIAPKPKHVKHLNRVYSQGFIEYIIVIISKYRPWIYVSSVVLVCLGAYGMTKIISTGNVTGDIPENDQISVDLKYIERNFGGSIPFEILINYKTPKRYLIDQDIARRIDSTQRFLEKDSLFSKSISYVDGLKVLNMALFNGDSSEYVYPKSRNLKRIGLYKDKFDQSAKNGIGFSEKDLIYEDKTLLRIRTQMKDLGSYRVAEKVDTLKLQVDHIINPNRDKWERAFRVFSSGNKAGFDSLMMDAEIKGGLCSRVQESIDKAIAQIDKKMTASSVHLSSEERNKLLSQKHRLENDKSNIDSSIYSYANKKETIKTLRSVIDSRYLDVTFTGLSVVVAEGTKYLFINLLQSLVFAILSIALLMAVLFRSIKIIVISMIPNIIPLLITAGIMGYFKIPLKPSTLLVFGIALGITVDNAILFLAKYRQELKLQSHNMHFAILKALRETGLGIFYTSVILFFGFIMFVFSKFGGTKGLGLLVSITILVGMATNLLILPALLLSLQKKALSKSFEDPYFEIYDEESDYDPDKIMVENNKD